MAKTLTLMAETPIALTENPIAVTSENSNLGFKSKKEQYPSFSIKIHQMTHTHTYIDTSIYT